MKRQYKSGEPIRSLDELCKQEFVIMANKTYHIGWVKSWPLRVAQQYIDGGRLYKAERMEK